MFTTIPQNWTSQFSLNIFPFGSPLQVANHFWTPQKLFGKKTDHLAQQHSTTLIQTELNKIEDVSMPHVFRLIFTGRSGDPRFSLKAFFPWKIAIYIIYTYIFLRIAWKGGQHKHNTEVCGPPKFLSGGSNNNVDHPKNHGTLQSKGRRFHCRDLWCHSGETIPQQQRFKSTWKTAAAFLNEQT